MPHISLLVAVAQNGVIGRNNRLPWHLPADLKRFKQLTLGKPVLMGRKTYDSIIDQLGKILPDRDNIVITRQADFHAPGCRVANSVREGLEIAGDADEIVVIGGGQIFEETLPIADRIYMTWVQAEVEGDAYFPHVDWDEWKVTFREQGTGGGDHPFEFVNYER
ncbi:MAG TPA: dihydrofolate reductase [Burkholderiales bacterium]|nr:dihydrofolate reductase [Burkholderiales bacterium]